MKSRKLQSRFSKIACGAALCALSVGAAMAQVNVKGDTGIDTSGDVRQERAWCMVNTEGEARVDCIKGANAAAVEKRRGTLTTNGNDYAANALARCNVFMDDERLACQARVVGLGSASGSVKGGGVIKGVETLVVPKKPEPVVVVPGTRG